MRRTSDGDHAPTRHRVLRAMAALWGGILRHPILIIAMAPLAAVVLAAAYVLAIIPQTPDVADMRKVREQQPSTVLSSDGKTLATLRRANREWVPLSAISPSVVEALLATEDQRFYDHHGLDVRRTLGAAWATFRGRLQGGSTITQQLARNMYPEEIGRAPTLERKVKEAITAVKIEKAYSKEEILETYLNTVPFLYNAFGIEMAARTYFDRSARELDVLQSATLVGMLKGTTYYNPVLNPQRARDRRNTVLAQLARVGRLDKEQLATLRKAPLRLDFEQQQEDLGPAPHFVAQVRRWLIEWADRNGYDVYADGLVVRTTLDMRAQDIAARAVAAQAERLQKTVDATWSGKRGWAAQRALVDTFIRESAAFQAEKAKGAAEGEAIARLRADTAFMDKLREDKTRLQAGFVAIEPGTGYVRAWVGSRDFAVDQFDHVGQARRQPGSTFKPFVYGAAFLQGSRPTDVLFDEVMDFQVGQGEVWRPTDITDATGEATTLRDALALSKNTITAQVTQRVGPANIAQLARAMGVRDSKLNPVMSLGLGTSPVTLREMVSAYGTIANGGRYVPPMVIARVEDRRGRVLQAFEPAAPDPVLPLAPDLVLLDAMRGVIDRGTGTAIRTRYGLQGDLAGKTGTTQDNTDGWFVLMHPQLVAGSWVGFNDSRLTMQDPWGQGARSALPMVGEFYRDAFKARLLDAKARFARPTDPEVAQEINAWWGNTGLVEPTAPLPELAALPALTSPTVVEAVVLPPPASEMWPPGTPESSWRVQRGVVVAPPPSAAPPLAVVVTPASRPPERAVVAGQASGAGPAPAAAQVPVPPRSNPNGSQEMGW
jgi:penicillin-binding protein 1A